MGITIDDASKNYSTIDTLQYNNGDWINIDEHILEIIPDYRLSTSAMLFLAKLYETAIFRILSNQPTP